MQSESINIADSEEFFQSIISEFPLFRFEEYLGLNAKIVDKKLFESALVKIQSAQESQLSTAEAALVKMLELPTAIPLEAADGNRLSFVDRAMKRQKLKKQTSSYIDSKFLIPTSNHVERLFSMSKRIFSLKRRRLLPRNLEALVLLKANRRLWDVSMVSAIMNEADEVPHVGSIDFDVMPDSDDEFLDFVDSEEQDEI